ncbi:MAG: hypothetical protein ABR961_14395 [Thermoanaerobaculaceae bacterium]
MTKTSAKEDTMMNDLTRRASAASTAARTTTSGIVIAGILTITAFLCTQSYADWNCDDVKTGRFTNCAEAGCNISDPGVSTACTAAKCVEEKLKLGEQMCATADQVIDPKNVSEVRNLRSDQKLVCGKHQYWILDKLTPRSQACCVSEETSFNWRDELRQQKHADRLTIYDDKPCVALKNPDEDRNEQIACSAFAVMYFDTVDQGFKLVCNQTNCFSTNSVPAGGDIACRRFSLH